MAKKELLFNIDTVPVTKAYANDLHSSVDSSSIVSRHITTQQGDMLQQIADLASQAGPYATYGQLIAGTLFVAYVLYTIFHEKGLYPGIPAFGIDDKGWMRFEKARQRYTTQGVHIVNEAIKKFSRPYQIATDVGVKIFLPAPYAEEIKNIKSLSFKKAIQAEFFGYSGLEPLEMLSADHNIVQNVIRKNITQTLNLIADDISEEAGLSITEELGENEEWISMPLKPLVLELVSRLSSRLFVGTELCRNKEWLQLVKNYTLDTIAASQVLKGSPMAFRGILTWILPEWRKVRQDVKDTRRILAPVIEARLERNRLADAKGVPRPRTNDTIQWFSDAFESNAATREIADAQLALSVVAIHTTSELLSGVLLDLSQNEDFIKELREEIVTVMTKASEEAAAEGHDGTGRFTWKKTTLYQMKLLDSALKETQRMHVRDIASMRRIAEAEVKLSDGTVIPKGAFSWVTLDAYRNPERYPNPEVYDPRRFLDMRNQPGQENKWQLVTTSADHLGFGHGEHACPGRFFASNEVKIALVHLLLKYDWKLPAAWVPGDVVKGGTTSGVDSEAKILFRRRKEEVQL